MLKSEEREHFIDNLAMLLEAGMDLDTALHSLSSEARSPRFKKVLSKLQDKIEEGMPLWKAVQELNLIPNYMIYLLKIGEESGRLNENLEIILEELEKERDFKSRVRSAMIYPVFVFSIAVIVGLSSMWFVLSRLATVFSSLGLELPFFTQLIIYLGIFLRDYGWLFVPSLLIGFVILVYIIFILHKTRFLGEYILLSLPGTRNIIQDIEISRFGYTLSTLIGSGVEIIQAINSLYETTPFYSYRKFYLHLKEQIEDGGTFRQSFISYKKIDKLFPSSVQEMVITAEKSGTLSKVLSVIAKRFERRIDTATKNLTAVLEPILLFIVWGGVVMIAFAVILPIYTLIGNINQGVVGQKASKPIVDQEDISAVQNIKIIDDAQIGEIEEKTPRLKIKETEVGYLNVRSLPSLEGDIISRVKPGEIYRYFSEENGWYEIEFDSQKGWIAGWYVEILE